MVPVFDCVHGPDLQACSVRRVRDGTAGGTEYGVELRQQREGRRKAVRRDAAPPPAPPDREGSDESCCPTE